MTSPRVQATPTVQIDNERVRVTEWRFPVGAETGWHTHGLDYVVVPQTSGDLVIETREGSSRAALQSGLAYAREKGVEHNVVNANEHEFVFVEVEIK